MTISPLALSSELKHAILYLRVSTPRQMDTAIDIDPDGNSIATQREFGQRRADTLNAVVDRVFIEPGNSAQSIEKRPVFREVLAYLREHPEIDYVIIYMRSRAFRNFTDAALTKRQLAKMGVKLVSAKEDFGEGYVADAMEGIIDIFNEMEIRRNGEDIKAKLRHKALNGGTVTRAKARLSQHPRQAGRPAVQQHRPRPETRTAGPASIRTVRHRRLLHRPAHRRHGRPRPHHPALHPLATRAARLGQQAAQDVVRSLLRRLGCGGRRPHSRPA